MQRMTIKTAATTTDLGRFTAIAAAWTIDREGDQIVKGAFAATIKRWQESAKRLPVHWNHSGAASDVIGWIDPAGMRETDEGLLVKGQLDLQDSETAREAWRSMKNNAVSLSFGYMISKSRDREDGIRELLGVDLFEISIVPHPANEDTRFLELKGARETTGVRDLDTVLDDEFRALKATWDRIDRQRDEEVRKERELERWIEEIDAETAREAKRNRPIQIKRFEV